MDDDDYEAAQTQTSRTTQTNKRGIFPKRYDYVGGAHADRFVHVQRQMTFNQPIRITPE